MQLSNHTVIEQNYMKQKIINDLSFVICKLKMHEVLNKSDTIYTSLHNCSINLTHMNLKIHMLVDFLNLIRKILNYFI